MTALAIGNAKRWFRTGIAGTNERAWRFAAELSAGQPLGAALDAAVEIDAPALLAEHIAAGRFTGFDLADAVAHPPAQESLS